MASFEVEGMAVPVLVARVDGEIHATSGMCPHEDVELAGGCVVGREIMCPGHGYFFDIGTGACTPNPELVLPVYRVIVEDDEVWIDLMPRSL